MSFALKITVTSISTVMISAAVAALAGAVALADPPHGCPPGLAMQGRCAVFGGLDRRHYERLVLRLGERLRVAGTRAP